MINLNQGMECHMKMFKQSLLMSAVIIALQLAVSQAVFAEKPETRVSPVSADKDKREKKSPIKIAVLGLENNPFWEPVKEGVLQANKDLKGRATVEWIVPLGDEHISGFFHKAMEEAVAKGYDAIATIAGDKTLSPAINKAVEAGVPVATFNSETNDPNKRLFYVGAVSYQQGQKAGEEMIKAIGKTGEVVVMTGFFAVEAHEERRKGFVDYIKKNSKIKILEEVENNDKGFLAYSLAEGLIEKYPNLSAFYVTAGGPFGVGSAVEDADKAGKIKIICYDFVEETMELVNKGVITGTIGQGPYAQGYEPPIRLFNYLLTGEKPKDPIISTNIDFVTKENISKYWKP